MLYTSMQLVQTPETNASASCHASVNWSCPQVGATISGRPGNMEDAKSLKQLNFQVPFVSIRVTQLSDCSTAVSVCLPSS